MTTAEMRSTWVGSLSFGLVTIPVKQYAGIEDKPAGKVKFSTVHSSCNTPVKNSPSAGAKPRCPKCDVGVNADDLRKAVDIGGTFVQVDPSHIDAVALDKSPTLEVKKFVPSHSIDPAYYDSFFLLSPQSGGAKHYLTLLKAMQDTDTVAVARQIKGGEDYVLLVRPVNDRVIGMTRLRRAAEVRQHYIDQVAAEVEQQLDGNWPFDAEIELAKELISIYSGVFDPAEFPDRKQEALQTVVEAAQKGNKIKLSKPVEAPEPADLQKALKESIKAARAAKNSKVKSTKSRIAA